jgi:hypothetical protein
MKAFIRCSLTAVALVASLGACSGDDNPASPSADASVPQLDGGVTLGSGSRATSEDPTGYTTTAADSGSTAGRGGVTLGSGS